MVPKPTKYNTELVNSIFKATHIIEKKYNGIGISIYSNTNKWFLKVSRSGKDITKKFEFLLNKINLIPNSEFGGELIYFKKGEKVENLNNIMKLISSSANYEKILSDMLKEGFFKIVLYYCIKYNNEDMFNISYLQNREIYIKAAKQMGGLVYPAEEIKANSIEKLWDIIKKQKIEGAVLKSGDDPIGETERSNKMVKIKKHDTIDLIAYKYTIGTSGTKNVRQKLVVSLGAYDKKGNIIHITDLSNFNVADEMIIKEKLDKKELFVIEIDYFEKTGKSLLIPKFIRFRWDKDPKECIY